MMKDETLSRLRQRRIVPIHDFIVAKRKALGFERTNAALRAIEQGLVPNTSLWRDHFKANGPVVIGLKENRNG